MEYVLLYNTNRSISIYRFLAGVAVERFRNEFPNPVEKVRAG
jgi:hypothetical protein